MKKQRPKKKQANKGHSATYRNFSFHVPQTVTDEEFHEMKAYIRRVRDLYNEDVGEDEIRWKDGEVVFQALYFGLAKMIKLKKGRRRGKAK